MLVFVRYWRLEQTESGSALASCAHCGLVLTRGLGHGAPRATGGQTHPEVALDKRTELVVLLKYDIVADAREPTLQHYFHQAVVCKVF